MNINNIFEAIPENLQTEVFERLAEANGVKIERIISKGHKSSKTDWYDQASQEWVMLLQGEAVLSFIDEPAIKLKAGDFLNIPAHKKHRVEWTTPDVETIWLAVHY